MVRVVARARRGHKRLRQVRAGCAVVEHRREHAREQAAGEVRIIGFVQQPDGQQSIHDRLPVGGLEVRAMEHAGLRVGKSIERLRAQVRIGQLAGLRLEEAVRRLHQLRLRGDGRGTRVARAGAGLAGRLGPCGGSAEERSGHNLENAGGQRHDSSSLPPSAARSHTNASRPGSQLT